MKLPYSTLPNGAHLMLMLHTIWSALTRYSRLRCFVCVLSITRFWRTVCSMNPCVCYAAESLPLVEINSKREAMRSARQLCSSSFSFNSGSGVFCARLLSSRCRRTRFRLNYVAILNWPIISNSIHQQATEHYN